MTNTNDLVSRLEQDVRVMTEARMLRDSMTNGDIEATRQMLHQYINQHGLSITQTAQSVGRSAATISQFLADKYAGDSKDLCVRIRSWIDQDIQQRRSPKYEGFVMTGVAQRIMMAIQFAAKTSGIALIHGPAGIGKTMTLKAWQKKQPTSIYVRINVASTTQRGILAMIAEAAGIRHYSSSGHILDQIVAKLASTGRMILVDEAHRLKVSGLEALRDVHDLTGCPMALIGTIRIVRQIDEGLRDCADWITDQFDSRSCIRTDLLAAMRGGNGDGRKLLFTQGEIEKIFDSKKLRLLPEASRWLSKLAGSLGSGGLRRVQRVLTMCDIAYPDQQISLDIVKAAYTRITDSELPTDMENYEQEIPAPNVAAG